MAKVTLKSIDKSFGDNQILPDIDLSTLRLSQVWRRWIVVTLPPVFP